MARIRSKGTVLQLSISAVFTTIAGVRSLKAPKGEVGVYDSTSLESSAGRPKDVTGYVEGGMVTGSLWFDPVAATHQALTDLVTTPTDDSSWKIIFADAAPTTWAFTGCVKSFGPVSVELDQGLQADFEIQVDGMVTYPT